MMEKEMVIDMRVLIDDIREKVNHGQSVILKGDGVSMLPFITGDDLLTLEKPRHQTPKIGEIYLYERDDGRYAIHRVYAVRKEWVYMLGDGQMFIEKVPRRRLAAVVSAVKRPHETVDCTDPMVRLRGAVRMKMRVARTRIRWAIRGCLGKAVRLPGKIMKMVRKGR